MLWCPVSLFPIFNGPPARLSPSVVCRVRLCISSLLTLFVISSSVFLCSLSSCVCYPVFCFFNLFSLRYSCLCFPHNPAPPSAFNRFLFTPSSIFPSPSSIPSWRPAFLLSSVPIPPVHLHPCRLLHIPTCILCPLFPPPHPCFPSPHSLLPESLFLPLDRSTE